MNRSVDRFNIGWAFIIASLFCVWALASYAIYVSDFFGEPNKTEFEGLSYVVSVTFIVPSAVIFILNQEAERRSRKETSHKYVIERHHQFLMLCLSHPEFGLETGRPQLMTDEKLLVQRDIIFDVLTSLFETAYITYSDSRYSFRKEQWAGWSAYIDRYACRPDYQEYWHRVMFCGELEGDHSTEYDARFDGYIVPIMERRLRYSSDWKRMQLRSPMPISTPE